jgi:hypothetical protein
MRQAARVDANQSEVVDALRKIGASVQPLHMVGHGVPDLLVGYHGQNFLLEVKDGRKPPSHRVLTPDEQTWFDGWRGSAYIVYSGMDAVTLLEKLTAEDDAIPF